MNYIINNVTIYTENEVITDGFIHWQGSKIKNIGSGKEYKQFTEAKVISGQGKTIIPGMIDIHIHGTAGCDVMDATPEALETMTTNLPREGTTSFLATTMTQHPDNINNALKNINVYMNTCNKGEGAELLGVHLEGPFVNTERAGAQPREYIIPPNITLFQEFQKNAGGKIKIVTFAPEIAGSDEFIDMLIKNNVIPSIGHSAATAKEAEKAIAKGAEHVTHFYNGLTPFHHREASVIGAALLNKDQYIEMIVDGLHISPYVVNLTYQLKGADNILLITDSMRAKYLADGTYELGGQAVTVQNGAARLAKDGNLAGSTVKMKQVVKNMLAYTNCSLAEVIKMTAVNQAKRLNIFDRKGSIAVEKDADMVMLNEKQEVVMTICQGKIAYEKMS